MRLKFIPYLDFVFVYLLHIVTRMLFHLILLIFLIRLKKRKYVAGALYMYATCSLKEELYYYDNNFLFPY